ncbi:MAG: divalent-cation tolerance protein CutA [Deltaproteobacteria bacterium]|nr:divalent-cation tolerance protein CutA [Deltaproteobacteria bacterium]
MDVVIAYITATDKTEAEKLGKALVTKKLAACVNILDGMHSMYWWKGVLEESTEAVVIAKTVASEVDGLIAEVKKVHSYEVPCVLVFGVQKGNLDYMRWIKDNVGAAGVSSGREKP